nr:GDSL esterase/lipase At5g45960 isoform X4 [Ziziphus jujuba var. spinosa]
MESPNSHIIPLLLIFLHVFWFTPKASQALTKQTPSTTNTVSALLVFGDSTVDSGNNNYVQTLFKSNFQPYGRDFINQRPTGRFTNGRLSTDYIASYMGIKEFVPPYLDPSLSIKEMMTGVSFASAGSGFDPLTSGLSNVIPIQKQLEYFKEYKKRLELAIGKQQAESHIEKAIFIISAGTNDFVVNYFTLPVRRKTYTVSNYQQFIIQNLKDFVQDLLHRCLWTVDGDDTRPNKFCGCCGTGYLEASFMCNPKSFACPDASKYVFWDSIHPTQTAYYIVFKAVRHVLDLLIKN